MTAITRATQFVLGEIETAVTVRTTNVSIGSIRCIQGPADSRPLSGKADVKPHKADIRCDSSRGVAGQPSFFGRSRFGLVRAGSLAVVDVRQGLGPLETARWGLGGLAGWWAGVANALLQIRGEDRPIRRRRPRLVRN